MKNLENSLLQKRAKTMTDLLCISLLNKLRYWIIGNDLVGNNNSHFSSIAVQYIGIPEDGDNCDILYF